MFAISRFGHFSKFSVLDRSHYIINCHQGVACPSFILNGSSNSVKELILKTTKTDREKLSFFRTFVFGIGFYLQIHICNNFHFARSRTALMQSHLCDSLLKTSEKETASKKIVNLKFNPRIMKLLLELVFFKIIKCFTIFISF